MENLEKDKRRQRRGAEARKSGFRRARIPMLTITGTLAVAFVGIPLSFEYLDIKPTVVEVAAEMARLPEPTPTPPMVVENAVEVEAHSTPQSSDAGLRYSLLKRGDTDAGVVDIQNRLAELLYIDGGEPTEYFGEPLEAAVRRFQRVHHMNETGEADQLTQELIFSDEAAVYRLQQGDSGEDVESLQDRLYELGYEVEKRNGYFGVATYNALVSFQGRNGLEQTGIMDSDTADILYSNSARPKVDPTPTPTPKPTPSPTPKPTKRPDREDEDETPGGNGGQIAVTKTADPNGGPAETPRPEETPSGGGTPITSGGGSVSAATGDVNGFMATATSQVGKPYVLGDEGPDSYDCSGLVYYSLTNNGVKVGRLSAKSYAIIDSWQTVSASELQPGDLMFFWNDSKSRINHTGIWLGGGKYVHASASAEKVVISSWSDWAERSFSHGKRVY